MPRGGYRPGAGRPKKAAGSTKPAAKKAGAKASTRSAQNQKVLPPPTQAEVLTGEVLPANLDPLDYMLMVMNDSTAEADRRDRMAIAAAPYKHGKVGEAGKKQQKAEAARGAGAGRFGARPAPGAHNRPN